MVPAMVPYDLGWPNLERAYEFQLDLFSNSGEIAWREGNGLLDSPQHDGTAGLGYFADGDQLWTYDRRNFLLYELWARAKTFSTGGLTSPESWSGSKRFMSINGNQVALVSVACLMTCCIGACVLISWSC